MLREDRLTGAGPQPFFAMELVRGNLATHQQEVRASLPPIYNEKLVYSCSPAPADYVDSHPADLDDTPLRV